MIDTTITNEWVDVMALPGAPGPVSNPQTIGVGSWVESIKLAN